MPPDVFTLLRRGYAAVFSDFKTFLDIAWPWLGMSVLAVYAYERLSPSLDEIAQDGLDKGVVWLQFFLAVINLLSMCGFLAKWTRWLALGEAPTGLAVLAFRRREWRVVGVTLACGLATGLPVAATLFLPSMSADGGQGLAGGGYVLILLAVALAACYAWLRLSLAPLLAALDFPVNALKASWRLTGNRVGRLVLLMLAAAFPLLIVQIFVVQLVGAVFGFEDSMTRGTLGEAVQILCAILTGFMMMVMVLTAQVLAAQAFMQADAEARPK